MHHLLNDLEAMKIAEIIKGNDLNQLEAHCQKQNIDILNYTSNLGTILHLTVSFGTLKFLESVLKLGISINVQNSDGNTCLLVACKLGKAEMVNLLLVHDPDISLKNKKGENAQSVTEVGSILSALENFQKAKTLKETKMLHKIVECGTVEDFKKMASNKFIDINFQDADGNTVLHKAVLHDKPEIVRLCLEFGCEPEIKNYAGKTASELSKKQIGYLFESRNASSVNLEVVKLEGELLKWTNYAIRYKKRWFVLENGILSYYKSREDYPEKCRGSINIKTAKVWMDGSDKYRFDVATDDHSVRYHLRAEHLTDAKKWIVALSHARYKESDVERRTSMLSVSSSIKNVPFADYTLESIQTATANLDASDQLFKDISDYITANDLPNRQQMAQDFYRSAMFLNNSIREALVTLGEREKFWTRKFDEELKQKQLIEENLEVLAAENIELESEYQKELEFEEEEEFFDAEESIDKKFDVFDEKIKDYDSPKFEYLQSSLLGYPVKHRTTLVCHSRDMPKVNLWKILKNAIGKDLSRIPLPVNFNEPLSMLQRTVEDMEYASLLQRASAIPDSLVRIQCVAAFAISPYAATDGRTSKPFNPLLGETFEYTNREFGYRVLCEQVSHHPPISALYCESEYFVFWEEISVKTKFWGKSLEVTPLGTCHLILKKYDEHYYWRKPQTTVNNIILGKLWIDNHGPVCVTNTRTNEICELDLKATTWRGKNAKQIEGKVFDAQGNSIYRIKGHQTKNLVAFSEKDDSFKVIWEAKPRPLDSPYNFSDFSIQLNETLPELESYLCITDSRFRPDQRAMEAGRFDEANRLKALLEETQRERKKQNEQIVEPVWFKRTVNKITMDEQWEYKGGYWEQREKGKWPDSPSIFQIEDVKQVK